LSSFFIYIGYGAGILFSCVGVAVLFGFFFQKEVPAQFKYILGSTLLLYGIYRLITTYFKAKRKARFINKDDETTNSKTVS